MNREVLICDRQESYVSALISFLMSRLPQLHLIGYSNPEDLRLSYEENPRKQYLVALLSTDFLPMAESLSKSCQRIYHLTEAGEESGYENFYKYQAMDRLVKQLESLAAGDLPGEGTFFHTIYSPVKHELLLPFAICYGRQQALEGRVLLVDLEEISLLPGLMGISARRNLSDFLYFLAHNPQARPDAAEQFWEWEDNLALLSAPGGLTELSFATEDEWQRLFDFLKGCSFREIILVYGGCNQGFSLALSASRRITSLTKPGLFYRTGSEYFRDWIRAQGWENRLTERELPLSPGQGADSILDEDGALGRFVRKEDGAAEDFVGTGDVAMDEAFSRPDRRAAQ